MLHVVSDIMWHVAICHVLACICLFMIKYGVNVLLSIHHMYYVLLYVLNVQYHFVCAKMQQVNIVYNFMSLISQIEILHIKILKTIA